MPQRGNLFVENKIRRIRSVGASLVKMGDVWHDKVLGSEFEVGSWEMEPGRRKLEPEVIVLAAKWVV